MPDVSAHSDGRVRLAALDGLRGIAIVLVVLSHGWLLWPTDTIEDHAVLRAIFSSGNAAVTIFFVVTGYIAATSMVKDRETGISRVIGRLARRWLRIGSHLYPLLVALVLWTALADPSLYEEYDTAQSIWRVSTFTWNWFLISDAPVARPDLGHLWYLSVDLQVLVLVAFLVALFKRHRTWLGLGLTGLAIASCAWRAHEFDVVGPYQSLLMSTTRMDALLFGAAAGLLSPHVARWRAVGPTVALASAALLVPVLFWVSDVHDYAGLGGFVLVTLISVLVLCCALAADIPVLGSALSWPPLVRLGTWSLGLFIWHYPVFWSVSLEGHDWTWQLRLVVAMTVTILVTWIVHEKAEQPVQEWISRRRWSPARGQSTAV
jgi:peptidoglycan/LPS O-acetylase OafA/YrhL